MQSNAVTLDYKNESKNVIQGLNSEICSCDLIYKAAKNPSKNVAKFAINKILSFASIDVRHNITNDTAVSKLAAEGDIDAVNLLRTEFNASLLWVVHGYAYGGYVDEANEVLALAQTPASRLLMLRKMACGYARGRFMGEANNVLELAETAEDRLILLKEIAYGCALSGYVDEANEVLDLVKTPADRHVLLKNMAQGYAQSKHVREANEVLALVQTPVERLILLQYMTYGYALGGHVSEVNGVLALAKTPEDRLTLLKEMAHGYAQGGHLDEARGVLALVETPQDRLILVKSIAQGYARGGHGGDEVNKILALAMPADYDILLRHMTCGYAQERHVAETNKMLTLTITDRYRLSKIIVTNLNKIAFANEHFLLQTLATFNPDFQKNIVNELKASKVVTSNETSLIRKVSKLNSIMHNSIVPPQNLSFNQAMGWIQPEVQIWLLQGPQLIKNGKIPATIWASIATFLLPNISLKDVNDLSNKLTLTICRERFFNSLTRNGHPLSYHLIAPSSENVATKKNSL